MSIYEHASLHQRTRMPGPIDNKAQGPGLIAFGPMVGWWRAEDLALADSATVTTQTWADRSGLGNNLTRFGGTGPIYRSTYQNGHAALEFDGNARHMTATSRVVPLSDFTLFVVMNWGGGRVIGLENDGGGGAGLALYNNALWVIRGGGTSDIGISGSGKMIMALQLGAGGGKSWKNGVAGNTTGGTGYSDAGVNFKIGGSGNGGSNMTGHVMEFAVYNEKLSDSLVENIFEYLNERYAIY